MKKHLVRLAALAVLGSTATLAQAQNVYLGVGLPNVYAVGYAHPMGDSWGLRGEYAGGTSKSTNGTSEGVNYEATFKSSRAGVFADWFAFGGGFRFVGGVTSNDTKLDVRGIGGPNTTIGSVTTDTTGKTFNVFIKYPTVTPYLGIGYGHQKADKGLGFYFDLGVSFGSFTADVQTDLVGYNGITQADIDEQKRKMNDALAKLSVLPSFSTGLVYRF